MIQVPMAMRVLVALCLTILLCEASPLLASETAPVRPKEKVVQRDKLLHEGVEVAFSIEPDFWPEVVEGNFAMVQFKLTDTATNSPLTTLRPSVWLDLQGEFKGDKGPKPLTCKEKIGLYLQGSLGYRPDLDLNSYFILSLNHDGTISVTDPIVSFAGITQLYTLVYLKRPGEDWAATIDDKRLFVTMPRANQVAAVDTETFKLLKDIDAGQKPMRIALQPDGKYLWVGNDASEERESGVTVVDPEALKAVAHIPTGAGHHEIAFSKDSLYAFVTNQKDGTLSVIEIQQLRKVKDVKTGQGPVAVAFSIQSRAVYVAHERDGTVAVIDAATHVVTHRIQMKPGLRAMRFAPGDRYGFVANAGENQVQLFDTATNRILHTIEVEREPDQIAFTSNQAYIRSRGSEVVTLISLTHIGKEGTLPVVRIPVGQGPPNASPHHAIADAMVPTPEPGHMLITNPSDKIIYYYMEGMQFPMGSFRSYGGHIQRAVRVVDRSIREKEPGVYSARVKIPASGDYQIAFLLDSPRIVHCFEFAAKENPGRPRKAGPVPHIEFLTKEKQIPVGKSFTLRFKVMDLSKNEAVRGLQDVAVVATSPGSGWSERFMARDSGEGTYEVSLVPPTAGVYYMSFACKSLNADFRRLPYLILEAKAEDPSK